MQNFEVLRFLDKFSRIFVRLGIDYPVMRRILQVKLTLDGRRVPTVFSGNGKKKEGSSNFIYSLLLYGLFSVAMIPFMFGENYMIQMSVAFGIFIFLMMTTLVSDFSAVLLDVKHKNVIFTRPVSSRTLNTAKLVHICIYLLSLTIALTVIPLIVALARQGIIFTLVFIAEIILADLFIVVLTGLIYLLILRFFDGEKLKDMINYFQITLALVVSVGYQFIGQLFRISLTDVAYDPSWWQYFMVPVWFGAPFELILKGQTDSYYIIFSALVILAPAASIFFIY